MHKKVNEFPISLNTDNYISVCFKNGNILQTFDVKNLTKHTLPDSIVNHLSKILGFQSGVVMRLKTKNQIVGAIVYTKRVKQVFNNEEIKMLELLNEKIAEILISRICIS